MFINSKGLRGLLAASLVLLATGCASVPMAPAGDDAAAKQFATVPGKANVYIYRNESMGAAIKMGVYVDDAGVGQTAANTYINVQLAPGKHTVRGHAENNSEVVLDAEAGKNYYLWQEVKMGFGSARNALQLVDEATGQAAVRSCALVQTGAAQ